MKRALGAFLAGAAGIVLLAGLAYALTWYVDQARIAWRYDQFQVLQLEDGRYGFYGWSDLEIFDRCEDAQRAASSSIEFREKMKAEAREKWRSRGWNPLNWIELKYVPAEPVECGPKEVP